MSFKYFIVSLFVLVIITVNASLSIPIFPPPIIYEAYDASQPIEEFVGVDLWCVVFDENHWKDDLSVKINCYYNNSWFTVSLENSESVTQGVYRFSGYFEGMVAETRIEYYYIVNVTKNDGGYSVYPEDGTFLMEWIYYGTDIPTTYTTITEEVPSDPLLIILGNSIAVIVAVILIMFIFLVKKK